METLPMRACHVENEDETQLMMIELRFHGLRIVWLSNILEIYTKYNTCSTTVERV